MKKSQQKKIALDEQKKNPVYKAFPPASYLEILKGLRSSKPDLAEDPRKGWFRISKASSEQKLSKEKDKDSSQQVRIQGKFPYKFRGLQKISKPTTTLETTPLLNNNPRI